MEIIIKKAIFQMMWTWKVIIKIKNSSHLEKGLNSLHLGMGGSGGAPLSFLAELPRKESKIVAFSRLYLFHAEAHTQATH